MSATRRGGGDAFAASATGRAGRPGGSGTLAAAELPLGLARLRVLEVQRDGDGATGLLLVADGAALAVDPLAGRAAYARLARAHGATVIGSVGDAAALAHARFPAPRGRDVASRRAAAQRLAAALRDELDPLPDETVLAPADRAARRRGSAERAAHTLGELRARVPQLSLAPDLFAAVLLHTAARPPTPHLAGFARATPQLERMNVPRPLAERPGRVEVDATWGRVQPLRLHPRLPTLGELELIEHLRAGLPLIDSRPPQEFEAGTIPGAVSLPFDELPGAADRFDPAVPTALFCNGPQCLATSWSIAALFDAGHPPAALRWYRGGLHDWMTLGYPVTAAA